MPELPDNVDLNWLGRQAITQRNNLRSMRTDMDMLIRLVTRVDSTLDAIRADLRTYIAEAKARTTASKEEA